MKVLLLEDNLTDAVIVRALLRQQEWEVTLTYALPEALKALSVGDYDVVLSDLHIPGADAQTIFSTLRKAAKRLALVAYSGAPPEEAIAEVDAFLPKDGMKGKTLVFVMEKAVQLRLEIEELKLLASGSKGSSQVPG